MFQELLVASAINSLTDKKAKKKSSQLNNLNKKKVTSNSSIEPVPSNYLQLCTLKRCNLAHCSHAMQKKCKVVWNLLRHHHTLLPRWHQVMPSIYSLFTDKHISYLIQNCRGSDCAAQGCSNHYGAWNYTILIYSFFITSIQCRANDLQQGGLFQRSEEV